MKKLFILALSVMMILSLTACGKKKSEDIAITDDMSVVEKFDATFKNMSDDEGVTAEVMLEKMKEFLPSEMMVDIMPLEEVYNVIVNKLHDVQDITDLNNNIYNFNNFS